MPEYDPPRLASWALYVVERSAESILNIARTIPLPIWEMAIEEARSNGWHGGDVALLLDIKDLIRRGGTKFRMEENNNVASDQNGPAFGTTGRQDPE